MFKKSSGIQNNGSKIQQGSYQLSFSNDLSKNYKRCLFLMILFLLFQRVHGECQSWGPNNQCMFCSYKCGDYFNGFPHVQYGTCSYLGEDLTGFQCLDKCCSFVTENIFYGKSNRTSNCQLNACQNYRDRLIVTIILSSVGLMIFCIMITSCVCMACLCYHMKRKQVNPNPVGQNVSNQNVQEQSEPNQTGTNLLSEQLYENNLLEFLENNKNQLLLKIKQVCAICTQNNTETMTSCGHYFHIDCIGKWIEKHSNCPTCDGNEQMFNPLIIYCKNCHYRVLRVKLNSRKGGAYQQMQKYKQTFCSTCRQMMKY